MAVNKEYFRIDLPLLNHCSRSSILNIKTGSYAGLPVLEGWRLENFRLIGMPANEISARYSYVDMVEHVSPESITEGKNTYQRQQ
jgi:hypothetical protein